MKAKKLIYLIAIYRDENGCFMSDFPDFPDMAPDYGNNFADCIEQSSKFLDAVVTDLVERNQPLPIPGEAESIKEKLDPDFGEIFCLVPITVYPPAKTERINITAKGNMLEPINDYAKKHKITRSELMVNATLEYIRNNA